MLNEESRKESGNTEGKALQYAVARLSGTAKEKVICDLLDGRYIILWSLEKLLQASAPYTH